MFADLWLQLIETNLKSTTKWFLQKYKRKNFETKITPFRNY